MIGNLKSFEITVDGSVSSDNGQDTADGGFGFYVKDLCFGYGYVRPRATNNISELMAMLWTCSYLVYAHGANQITFTSDSQYVCKGSSIWLPGWEHKDFDGVKNADLWRKVVALKRKCNLISKHVHGHQHKSEDHWANNLVDCVATIGRLSKNFTPTIICAKQHSNILTEYKELYLNKNTSKANKYLTEAINKV